MHLSLFLPCDDFFCLGWTPTFIGYDMISVLVKRNPSCPLYEGSSAFYCNDVVDVLLDFSCFYDLQLGAFNDVSYHFWLLYFLVVLSIG